MFEFIFAVVIIFFVMLLAFTFGQLTQLQALRRRIEKLEDAALEPAQTPRPAPPAMSTQPEPESSDVFEDEPPWLQPDPVGLMAPVVRAAAPEPTPAPKPRRPLTADRLEELV